MNNKKRSIKILVLVLAVVIGGCHSPSAIATISISKHTTTLDSIVDSVTMEYAAIEFNDTNEIWNSISDSIMLDSGSGLPMMSFDTNIYINTQKYGAVHIVIGSDWGEVRGIMSYDSATDKMNYYNLSDILWKKVAKQVQTSLTQNTHRFSVTKQRLSKSVLVTKDEFDMQDAPSENDCPSQNIDSCISSTIAKSIK